MKRHKQIEGRRGRRSWLIENRYKIISIFLGVVLALSGVYYLARRDILGEPREKPKIAVVEVKGVIENLIPPKAFQGLNPTVLVLTNAIYFRAPWEHSFWGEQTQEGAFTLLDGENVEVPMMSSGSRPYPCTEGKNFKAVSISYLGDASMTVILPEEGHFEEVEGRLDAEFLEEVAENFERRIVTLKKPKKP